MGLVCKLTPYIKDRQRPKTEADHFRLVGGSFDKKGNLLKGLSWMATRQVDRSRCESEVQQDLARPPGELTVD